MSRYDDLSGRARWFLNNFDEIDLADICAAQEASNQTREAALNRIGDAFKLHKQQLISTRELYAVLETHAAPSNAADPADGPSVAEAAADDRAHWTQKYAGERAE